MGSDGIWMDSVRNGSDRMGFGWIRIRVYLKSVRIGWDSGLDEVQPLDRQANITQTKCGSTKSSTKTIEQTKKGTNTNTRHTQQFNQPFLELLSLSSAPPWGKVGISISSAPSMGEGRRRFVCCNVHLCYVLKCPLPLHV